MNKSKRQFKAFEEPYWDCSVCTYRNSQEAFKCLMCDIRKGTSTRKPKANSHLASQHAAQQYTTPLVKTNKKDDEQKEKSENKRRKKFKKSWRPSKLKNVDRSSAQAREITINNLTIMITEYKAKDKKGYADQVEQSSTSEMSSHSESGFDSKISLTDLFQWVNRTN